MGVWAALIREAFATEETIALAKRKACEILGVEEGKVEFEIIQEPERKKLGLFGGRMAQVRAFIKDSPAEKAKNYVKDILFYMGFEELEVEIEQQDTELCVIKITGDGIGNIVGRHGETLDALQYLAGFAANSGMVSPYCRIRLEAGDYREKRRKSLEAFGRRMAYRALRLRERIDIEPMRSYERKLLHIAMHEVVGVSSWSEGEDGNRHVVVAPAGKKYRERSGEALYSKYGDEEKDKSERVSSAEDYSDVQTKDTVLSEL